MRAAVEVRGQFADGPIAIAGPSRSSSNAPPKAKFAVLDSSAPIRQGIKTASAPAEKSGERVRHREIQSSSDKSLIAFSRPILARSAALICAPSNQFAASSTASNGQSIENSTWSAPSSAMALIIDGV